MDDSNVIEVFLGTLLVLIIGIGLVFIAGLRFSSVTGGVHTGYVTAVDQRGYIFPNYVVYFKTDNSSSQEDDYCVNRNNRALGEKLRELSQQRKLVSVSYQGVRGWGFGLCEGTEITAVSLDTK